MYTQEQLIALRDFLVANAATYGALDDQQAADALNALTETRVRASMTGAEIAENIDAAEYDLLSSQDKGVVLALCAIDRLNPANGTLAHQTIVSIFGAGATATALLAARQESVSPATLEGLPRCRADYVRIARSL